ncbi:unnamed protein product, partial [Nesidiocoris tenuis]
MSLTNYPMQYSTWMNDIDVATGRSTDFDFFFGLLDALVDWHNEHCGQFGGYELPKSRFSSV